MHRLVGDRRLHRRPATGVGERGDHRLVVRHGVAGEAERHGDLDHLHRVVERLVAVELGHRPALCLVGVQRVRGQPVVAHRGQLPDQVVHVGHTRVQAEAAGGREAVGGVADQEDPPVAVALGDLRAHVPRGDGQHLERHRPGHRGAHQVGGTLGGDLLLAVPHVHVDPLAVGAVGDERATAGRVDHEVQDTRRVTEQRPEVRRQMDHHERLDGARADQLDAQRTADATGRAVGRQHVRGTHGVGAVLSFDPRRHAAVVLLGRDPGVRVAHAQAVVEQQRLQPVLAEVAQRGGGDGQHLVALPFVRQRADGFAAEQGDPVDAAGLGRGEAGVEHRPHVHAGLPPDLERAGVDGVRGGGALRPLPTLDDDGRQPDLPAQVRGGEARGPGADHQHVDRLGGRRGVAGCARHQKTPS